MLLDAAGRAKLADLGLARLSPELLNAASASPVGSRAGVGTTGYLAPEALRGSFSRKTDTYSLGVILLQVLR